MNFLNFDLFKCFQEFIVTASFKFDLIDDFGEDCIDVFFDILKGFNDIFLEGIKFLKDFVFSLFDWYFDFGGIDVHGSEMGKIFFGLGDDHFERLDFVSFVLFI